MVTTSTLQSYCCNFSNENSRLADRKKSSALSFVRTLSNHAASSRMDKALMVFETLPKKKMKKDTFVWNVMIRGYTENGLYEDALQLFDKMLAEGVRCDNFTFPFIIKCCAGLEYLTDGLKIHGRVMKMGLDTDLFICNSLITMYSKLGLVEFMERVFSEMHDRDIVSWNSIIDGYASNGEGRKSLICFSEMQENFGFEPDEVAVMGALEACSLEECLKNGKEIHCYVIRHGVPEEIKVQTCLLYMYARCSEMIYAERLFHTMPLRNDVAWNVLISGYALNNQPYEALTCIGRMQEEKIDPDVVTMLNLLPACSQIQSANYGRALHGMAIRKYFISHVALETALIDMYAKCGELTSANLLFQRMTERSLVSWNTMITGYVQNGSYREAIQLLVNLQCENLEPDSFTFSSILPAYSEVGSLRQGRQIHGYVVKLGYERDYFILNSILYMYAKCGDIQTSRKVFDSMELKTIVSWNSMIMGYAIHGHGKSALYLFSQMQESGLEPNEITFASVLSACCISGMIDEAWEHFHVMKQKYGILPKVEHYSCMVDLMGRKGDMDKAQEIIERMPLTPTEAIWGSLLTASRNNNDIKVAEIAAERIFSFDHDNTGCYILLSKMYADAGRWDDVKKIRSLMNSVGLHKTTAMSRVELMSKSSTFINGDKSHSNSTTILEVSRILSSCIEEHKCNENSSLKRSKTATNETSLPNRHSVRLALCHGLISSKVGAPILIKKNVRVCNDCHNAMKLISRFTGREIIVGDLRLYHHFSNGFCTCADYW